jgi:hypothetical protein
MRGQTKIQQIGPQSRPFRSPENQNWSFNKLQEVVENVGCSVQLRAEIDDRVGLEVDKCSGPTPGRGTNGGSGLFSTALLC